MALVLRPWNWVSPHLGAVEGKEKEPGCPGPGGDSGCRAGRASVHSPQLGNDLRQTEPSGRGRGQ